MRKGLVYELDFLDVLTKTELQRILDGIQYVLKTTGVTVEDKQMQQDLRKFGCKIDDSLDRVYFGEEVISKALQTVPRGFKVTARNSENDIYFQPGKNTYFLNACGTKLFDWKSKTVYEPTRKDFYEYIKIIDMLPNVDIQNCFPLFGFTKVPECMRLLESVAAKIRMSTKVQIEGTVLDNYIFTTEISKALGIEICQIVNSAAPLTYYKETSEQLRNYILADVPLHFATGPIRGMTSPMTTTGSVIQYCAEIFAGIVMTQAIRPGARVWINSMLLSPNMVNATPAFGEIHNSICDMMFNQIWRYFELPCWSNAAAWTSSKEIDYQAGYEMNLAILSQAFSGATAISFQGGIFAELYVCAEKAIIDDDIVGMIKRLTSKQNCTDEGLAVNLINETGPVPGNYFESDLTLENWRDECYVTTVASTNSYDQWVRSGRKGILDKAEEKKNEMLGTPTDSLPKEQERKLEEILSEARNYYRKSGKISDEEWRVYQEDLNSSDYPIA